jgi:hypothetical protein
LHHVYARGNRQQRIGSNLIQSDEHLWTELRYIAMNPVAAGLCQRPEEWRWSSWGTPQPWLAHRRLMECLGAAGGDPEARLHELASATLDHPQGV